MISPSLILFFFFCSNLSFSLSAYSYGMLLISPCFKESYHCEAPHHCHIASGPTILCWMTTWHQRKRISMIHIADRRSQYSKNSRIRFARFSRNSTGNECSLRIIFPNGFPGEFCCGFFGGFFRAFFLGKNRKEKIHPKIHGNSQIRIWEFRGQNPHCKDPALTKRGVVISEVFWVCKGCFQFAIGFATSSDCSEFNSCEREEVPDRASDSWSLGCFSRPLRASSLGASTLQAFWGFVPISGSHFLFFWGVAKGSSISWVAKLKGDKNSEWKLSNGWSRS